MKIAQKPVKNLENTQKPLKFYRTVEIRLFFLT